MKKRVALYIVWLAGFLVLHQVYYYLQPWVQRQIESTFNNHYYWYIEALYFVFGLYASLLFADMRRMRFNPPLFYCVFVPCALVIVSLFFGYGYIIYYYLRLNPDILFVVSGIALLPSLFAKHRTDAHS